jgi:predicted PurR-regulated permease PerM
MTAVQPALEDKTHVTRAIDVAVRLFVVGIILYWSLTIIGPFLTSVLWGAIIAVALHGLYARLRSVVGGRDKVAAAIFILSGLAILIAPTAFLTESLIEGAVNINRQLDEGTLALPPPSENV